MEPMSSDTSRELLLMQMDEALAHWRDAALPARPKNGWVRNIRAALRMSAPALAKRLGVTARAVHKIETSEADDKISLATLRRVAEALEYALVPRKPLLDTLVDRARLVAGLELTPVAHTMALEDQTVDDQRRRHLDLLTRAMLTRSGRDLW
jgi:predicted DNA-binding mobile mystery protein A